MNRFTQSITAGPADIDELGHVNNAVWVRWIQDIAVAHWAAVAPPEHQAAYVWVVTRHEIDYRGNILARGEQHEQKRHQKPGLLGRDGVEQPKFEEDGDR